MKKKNKKKSISNVLYSSQIEIFCIYAVEGNLFENIQRNWKHTRIFFRIYYFMIIKNVNSNQILRNNFNGFFPQPTQVQNIQIPLLEEPLETEMLLEKLTNENIVGFECALVFLDLLKVCKIHNIVCRHICILMRKNSWKKTFLLLTSYQKIHVCFMMILLKSNLFLISR